MKKQIKKIGIGIGLVIGILFSVVIIYLCTGIYQAKEVAELSLETDEEVTVTDLGDYYFFDGIGTDKALIFYPGAKVDHRAYSPLIREIAKTGTDCFLVKMPFHMAMLDVNKADQVMSNYQYDTWYIGGHSMGGASAGMYASAHPDQIDGLFLVAAYTTKPVTADENMIVLSVYGDHDGVLSLQRVEECRQNATEAQYHEVIIPGGNHGQFGDYGMQTGDHIATITAEEQRAQTIRAWVQWM